jgi:hypothetical protein
MAERRKVRSGTGGRTSTRSREPADRDEQEMFEDEPLAPEEDELADAGELEAGELEAGELEAGELQAGELQAGELEEADDERGEADEPEAADEDETPSHGRRPTRRRSSAMTAAEAAHAALREIAQLTAKRPEGITGVERGEDGWTVGIELVEDQRIPSSADILAIYETTIDAGGELLSYRRVRRYARGRGDTEELR